MGELKHWYALSKAFSGKTSDAEKIMLAFLKVLKASRDGLYEDENELMKQIKPLVEYVETPDGLRERPIEGYVWADLEPILGEKASIELIADHLNLMATIHPAKMAGYFRDVPDGEIYVIGVPEYLGDYVDQYNRIYVGKVTVRNGKVEIIIGEVRGLKAIVTALLFAKTFKTESHILVDTFAGTATLVY